MHGGSKAHVFGKLCFITEPLRTEDFRGELRGDGLTDAGMRGEEFDRCADRFFTEGLFDFLLGGFELFGDEAEFVNESVEAEAQGLRQRDIFEVFYCGP